MEFFEYFDIMNKPYDIFYSDCITTPLHWHYYSEILYITKGSVSVTCNDQKMLLKKGDFVYIYPLQLHDVTKGQDEEVEYAVLQFDISTFTIPHIYISKFYDLFVRRTQKSDPCILLREEQFNSEEMHDLIDHMIEEFTNKNEFYSLQIQADIFTLLITVARKMKKEDVQTQEKHTDNKTFYHILEYIDTHSGEKLEIQALADMCHMSYSHFAKLFRENYGRSCKDYITYIRINKAQDLLLHTDYDLNYIAMETGFFDCSHFIRTYKRCKGITPKKERVNDADVV